MSYQQTGQKPHQESNACYFWDERRNLNLQSPSFSFYSLQSLSDWSAKTSTTHTGGKLSFLPLSFQLPFSPSIPQGGQRDGKSQNCFWPPLCYAKYCGFLGEFRQIQRNNRRTMTITHCVVEVAVCTSNPIFRPGAGERSSAHWIKPPELYQYEPQTVSMIWQCFNTSGK